MFDQIFLSTQVKRSVIISNKYGIKEMLMMIIYNHPYMYTNQQPNHQPSIPIPLL